MNILRAALSLAILSLLAGCSSTKVTFEQDLDYDFSKARTFQWIDVPGKILDEDNIFTHPAIQKVVNNELVARELQQVLEKENADLQVAYYLKLVEIQEYTAVGNQQESTVTSGFVLKGDDAGWSYKTDESDLNMYISELGTLTLLVYDVASGQQVWKGMLKTEVDRRSPIEKQVTELRMFAHKLMAPFPRQKKQQPTSFQK